MYIYIYIHRSYTVFVPCIHISIYTHVYDYVNACFSMHSTDNCRKIWIVSHMHVCTMNMCRSRTWCNLDVPIYPYWHIRSVHWSGNTVAHYSWATWATCWREVYRRYDRYDQKQPTETHQRLFIILTNIPWVCPFVIYSAKVTAVWPRCICRQWQYTKQLLWEIYQSCQLSFAHKI